MSLDFKKGELKENIGLWWKSLENNKKMRAELRRAKSTNEILLLGSFYSGYHEYFNNIERVNLVQMASIMGLLSHVERCTENQSLAQQMAQKNSSGNSCLLSENRFKKLLKCNRKNIYREMIRVIRLLNKSGVNIYNLADSVFYWGDKVKKDWAYDYYASL